MTRCRLCRDKAGAGWYGYREWIMELEKTQVATAVTEEPSDAEFAVAMGWM